MDLVLVVISELELTTSQLLAGVAYLSRLPDIRRVGILREPLRYVLDCDADVTDEASEALVEALSGQVTVLPLK